METNIVSTKRIGYVSFVFMMTSEMFCCKKVLLHYFGCMLWIITEMTDKTTMDCLTHGDDDESI